MLTQTSEPAARERDAAGRRRGLCRAGRPNAACFVRRMRRSVATSTSPTRRPSTTAAFRPSAETASAPGFAPSRSMLPVTRHRRGVDDVDRAAARGEQARAVRRQRQRADRAARGRRAPATARVVEVDDGDAPAGGDERARAVGRGGDRARRRAEVEAGDDLVGGHVGQDELVCAGRDDDRAGVGGGAAASAAAAVASSVVRVAREHV